MSAARLRRLRPVLLALSATVGVAVAGGGTLLAEIRPADRDAANAAATPPPTPQPIPTAPPTATSTSHLPGTSTTTPPATSSAVPTTTTTPPPPPSLADQVLALVNEARAGAGCDPVTMHAALVSAAQGHADDMAAHNYFSHESQDGRTFVDRAMAAGYPDPARRTSPRANRTRPA